MSKGGLVTLLGFVLALLPFLGIPLAVKTALAVVSGVVIMALGVLVREERRWLMRALSGDHQADAYTENSVPKSTVDARMTYAKSAEHSA